MPIAINGKRYVLYRYGEAEFVTVPSLCCETGIYRTGPTKEPRTTFRYRCFKCNKTRTYNSTSNLRVTSDSEGRAYPNLGELLEPALSTDPYERIVELAECEAWLDRMFERYRDSLPV